MAIISGFVRRFLHLFAVSKLTHKSNSHFYQEVMKGGVKYAYMSQRVQDELALRYLLMYDPF